MFYEVISLLTPRLQQANRSTVMVLSNIGKLGAWSDSFNQNCNVIKIHGTSQRWAGLYLSYDGNVLVLLKKNSLFRRKTNKYINK